MGWLKFVFHVVAVLLCLNVFQITLGLRCYSCQWMNGMGERECLNNPPPSRYLIECSQPQCWKKYSNYNGNYNIQRFCVALAGDTSLCRQATFEDLITGQIIPATECFCKTEGCNGSSQPALHNYNGLVVGSVVATGFLVKFSQVAMDVA